MSMSVAFVFSFGIVLVLTPCIKVFSIKYGFIAQPAGTRWHKEPTPLMGGIAIFIAFFLGLTYFFIDILNVRLVGFFLGAVVVFSVGVWDDVSNLRPVTKLLGQIIAACIAVSTGIHFNFGEYQFLAVILTVFWIASVTNAFNLIDNMDGLCVGTASISGLVLSAYAFVNGDSTVGLISAVIAGSCLGFLRYNFPPASIFLGDSGSMLLGYAFATVSIMATMGGVGNFLATLIFPVLVLGVPIFDTALVSFSRLRKGMRISQGGKDHTSHRLVILGLSERRTVIINYSFSLILGVAAFLYAYLNFSVVIVLVALLVSGAVVFGLFLGEVKVDQVELPAALSEMNGAPPAILGTNVFHKRAFIEMLIDLVSICSAFYVATLLRYEAHLLPSQVARIWVTLPITIPVKLVILYSFGLYRSMWRHLEFVDLLHIVKAVTIASAANIFAILMIWRFDGYSRSVIVIDWMLMVMLITGFRLLFRGLRESFPGGQKNSEKRVLIFGAGDAGEMLVKEILNNPRMGYHPVGFIDDNPGKIGRRMFGFEIMGGRSDLRRVVVEENVEEVIVAIPSASEEDLVEFFDRCSDLGVPCRRTHSLI